MKIVNTFDIDGVIYIGPGITGIYPGPNDIIITGRSEEGRPKTQKMLQDRDIFNQVYYNPLPFDEKTRESSGKHKATVINELLMGGFDVKVHYEDDPIQASIIRHLTDVKVITVE